MRGKLLLGQRLGESRSEAQGPLRPYLSQELGEYFGLYCSTRVAGTEYTPQSGVLLGGVLKSRTQLKINKNRSFLSWLYVLTHADGNTSDSACARLVVIGSFVFPRLTMDSRETAILVANGPCA